MECTICDNLHLTEEDYFCCIYENKIKLGFDVSSLMDKCPLDDG